ncbi:aldehyde dehydrogenase family protein [Nocardioides humilatus]|uniref:Aldehyde dehydrogenase family protein n=1 Tax=Nocardioides humilatus TaxID=2607660 RepID=A0A5B1L4S1_9ACTN|nr:aldehyde dehydrogenase family protein [Nocardioides humilatus]KAA1415436.1 aldehyde dehydrogenase family protein [Nocardioides humilatus]
MTVTTLSETERATRLVDRARRAQEAWGEATPKERAQALRTLPDLVLARLDEIVTVIHEENGKPRVEASAHEAAPAVALARHHVDKAPKVLGASRIRTPNLPHRKVVRHHRPYGVVVAIAPWNFPFLIPFSQVLPALLAGNAVVLKPSELTPRVARLLVEIVHQTGIDPDLLQLAEGDGATGAALVDAHPDKVLFTGSVATGRRVMAAAAQFPVPVGLELGGIDALVVLEDADLDFAAEAASWGATFNGGQACCSVERLIVARSIHDELVEKIRATMAEIPLADLGPAIDGRQLSTWGRHIEEAQSIGAQVSCGGHPLPGDRFAPTLVTDPHVLEASVWSDETFGPVVAAVPFDSEAEAVALHNDTRYGLTASVLSADTRRAAALAGRLNAGAVAVNEVAAILYSSPEVPWGGVGDSGFGRSHGVDALLDASWVQVIDTPRGVRFGPHRPWWHPYDPALEDGMAALAAAYATRNPGRRTTALIRAGRRLLPLTRRGGSR